MSLCFRLVSTRLGYVGIVGGGRGLRRVYLPRRARSALHRRIRADFAQAVEDRALLPRLADALCRYFEGRRVEFDVRLDCDAAPAFRAAVWRVCRRVGYGQTVSYGQLAARAGRPGAARAVGSAMSCNPWPIVVPCHRVLRTDGTPGGYSGPGGVALKRRLLAMEAATARGA